MKKTKSFLLTKLILVLIAVCLAVLPFAACDQDPKGPDTGESKTASYYCVVDGTEYTVTLEGTSFSLVIAGETKTGTFNLKGNTLVINPTDGEAITATLSGDEITLTYKGKEYAFLENKTFTVTFELDGGTGVANSTVKNGQKVQAPANAPVKDGYTFVGWFSDSACTKPYNFDVNERGNVTVYAKFIQNTSAFVFTATLMNGEEQVGTMQTVNGKLYNLPELTAEGKKFLGWWISQYGDKQKLSYKYENQDVEENSVLYAVWDTDGIAVSVSDKRISWNAQGNNVRYAVEITKPDGTEVDDPALLNCMQNYVDYDMTDVAGDYIITVRYGSKTGTAYYRHMGLVKVSDFTVEGNVLKFAPVPKAEGYKLTVTCENPEHDHTSAIALKDKTEYDFSSCGMTENGLSFVVEAYADGYISSYSEKYVLVRKLAKVNGLATDENMDEATWEAVENAEKYIVNIITAAGTEQKETTETKIDLRAYSGEFTVSVTAEAKCYVSSEAATLSLKKTKLAIPSDFAFVNGTFTWNAVENATGYIIKIGNTEFTLGATELSFTLTEEDYAKTGNAETAELKAVGGTLEGEKYSDSDYTEPLNFGEGALESTLAYQNGKVTWNGVFGATGYSVKVNGEVVLDNQKVTEYALELKDKNTKVAVCYYRGDKASQWIEITVQAYKITYVTGKEDDMYEYLANGDFYGLPAVTRVGYTFSSWLLDGEKVSSSTKFMANQDVSLVAQWNANNYKVTLDVNGGGTIKEATKTVTYGSKYELGSATTNDPLKAFAGWYTEPNGKGIQYADYTGASIAEYRRSSDCVLYAYWVEVFEFDLTNNNTEYAVSGGPGIGFMSTVTVPGNYNGKKVTSVVSFDGCSNMVELNLPDTITNVEVGMDGGYESGAAFNGCRNLLYINVYHVEGARNPRYKSVDGILYKKQETGGYELTYYPRYREGAYVIPSDVVELPTKSLYYKYYLTEVTIPSSVNKIGESAFASCSNLLKVTFLNGETEQEMTFGKDIFKSCSKLEEVTLPSYMKEIDITMFDGCSKMQNVFISNNANYKSVDGVLCKLNQATKQFDTIVYFPKGRTTEYTIPHGIFAIGKAAFKSAKITKLTIPAYVTFIDEEAFMSCSSITELVFEGKASDGDLTIMRKAFYGLSKIEELTLPENLKVVKQYAFGGTSKLRTLNVNTVRTVVDYEEYAFHTENATAPIGYLYYINIGKDMPKVDNFGNVFGGSQLKEVNVDEKNQSYFSLNGVLFSTTLGENAEIEIAYFPGGITGEYVIPETIEGKGTIKTIGGNVFYNAAIMSVVIPKSVTYIGDAAFRACKNLVTVTFENAGEELAEDKSNALQLGARIFMNCSELKNITLPQRLVFIGDRAFQYCSVLETITIPKNVAEMEELSASDYPAGTVTRNRSFDNCAMLAAINVEDGNQTYFSVEGILYKKNYDSEGKLTGSSLMICPMGKGGVVDIHPSVEKIEAKAFYGNLEVTEITFSQGIAGTGLLFGEAAFNGCKKLEKLSLPQGLQAINDKTFYQCESLQEVFIPKTVTYIGVDAFGSCKNLKKVIIEDGYIYNETEGEDGEITTEIANYLTIADGEYTSDHYGGEYYTGAFANCPALTEITIPGRAKIVGKHAFANDGLLKKITLSEGVETIDEGAFRVSGVEEIVFAETNTLKTIENSAFYKANLKNLVLPEGVTAIKYNAFYSNKQLESVVLPSTLSKINGKTYPNASSETGYSNFGYCESLKSVTFRKDKDGNTALETIGSSMFWACYALESIELPKSITTIMSSAFNSTKALKTVTFEEGSNLELIDSSAFSNSGIQSIKLPKSIKTIGNGAFSGCTNLTKVEFEEVSNLASIGATAFTQSALTEFRFPVSSSANGITLGNAMFQNCKNLTTVYLSESVASIEGAFSKCSSITSLVISEKSKHFKVSTDNAKIITNAEGTAIRYILGTLDVPAVEQKDSNGNVILGDDGKPVMLKEFKIPQGIIEISANAFEGQKNIEKVVVSSDVQVVGKRAFANCLNLKEVVFEEGCVPTIGSAAFSGCYSLETAKLPSLLAPNAKGYYVINEQLFDGCRNLKNVTLPQNTTHIGKEDGGTGYAYTFRNCFALEELKLPSTLKVIAAEVFEFSGLKSIVIPASVEKIGGSKSFYECRDLETVTFENAANINSLGGSTFAGCTSLKTINLSAITQVKSAPSSLFLNCASLESVVLPDCFTSIASNMFEGCTSLTSVNIPAKATSIGTKAFLNCESLKEVVLPETIDTINAYAFSGSGITSINIPAKVQVLGTSKTSASTSSKAYTFAECKDLTTVTFTSGSKCVKLGGYVFQGCEKLENIDLKQFTQLGYYAFDGCSSLKSIDITKVTTYSNLPVGCFRDCTSLTDIKFSANLTAIGPRVFQGCTALTEVTLPAKLTSIGANVTSSTRVTAVANYDKENESYGYTFAGCTNLKTVKFAGNAIICIGYKAFAGCENLTEIAIPMNNFKFLLSFAFENTGITEFTIGSKMEYIGTTPMLGCSLEKVNNNNENIVVDGSGIIYNADKSVIYYYPAELPVNIDFATVNASTALYGNTTETEVTLPAGITEITAKMFYGFKGLKKIVIPEGVTEIGDYAFYGCTGLTEVVLPSTLTEIGQYAFQNTGITAITLPESLTTIGKGAFQDSALKTITLPAGITAIGNDAFRASALESVVIDFDMVATESVNSSGVTTYSANSKIGSAIFADCDKLASVTFNGQFNWVQNSMFLNDTALTQFTFPEEMKRIDQYAFQNTGIKEVVIPEGFYYFNGYAFKGSAVERVVVKGHSNGSLGTEIFADCDKLVYADVRGITSQLGTKMFMNCTALATVKLNEGLGAIYNDAFTNCTSIKALYISGDTRFNYKSYLGWTKEQTIYIACEDREFASKEYNGEWVYQCDAKIVLIDEFPAEEE